MINRLRKYNEIDHTPQVSQLITNIINHFELITQVKQPEPIRVVKYEGLKRLAQKNKLSLHLTEFQVSNTFSIVSKFGGQPIWLKEPEWPIMKDGKQQIFLGQIQIDPRLFGHIQAKVAYLFLYQDETSEETIGDIILQPGGNTVPNVNFEKGPVYCDKSYTFNTNLVNELDDMPKSNLDHEAIIINKIGGAPVFLQHEDFPEDEKRWYLLLQIDMSTTPLAKQFDYGIRYVFLSPDGKIAKMIIQSD